MKRSAHLPILGAMLCLLAAGGFQAHASTRADPLSKDEGTYRVYFRDRLLGTEKFKFLPMGDSTMVASAVDQVLPTASGDQRLEKKLSASFATLDYGLLSYASEQKLGGQTLKRGIAIFDTTMTLYTESRRGGSGDTYARPPGRLFVIDNQLFVLFDVMIRGLHGKMIGDRDLPVVVLSAGADTIVQIQFSPGPNETIRAGGRELPARRVSFHDENSNILAWVDGKGRMVRLEQPEAGLRVERDADLGTSPLRKPAPAAARPRQATGTPPPKTK